MSEQPAKREAINGVFSSQEVRKVGTGTTTRKSIQKTMWIAAELPDGQIEVQPLNINYVPSGPKKVVSREDFLQGFSPEPEVYQSQVFPKMRELNKNIATAERHRKNKEYFSAEMEYNNVLRVDEENVRANFGLGITYLERGDNAKADDIFERLVKLDAAFELEHKHLFNEFGINLRKSGMLDQAVSYYTKAQELSGQDANLCYNIARVLYEKKELEKSLDFLIRSLELDPRLEVSVKFLLWLLNRKEVPEFYIPNVAAALQRVKDAQESGPAAPASE